MAARLWQTCEEAVRTTGAAVLVRLAKVEGSSPRENGAFMVMGADGRIEGSVGGGQLEYALLQLSRDILSSPQEKLVALREEGASKSGGSQACVQALQEMQGPAYVTRSFTLGPDTGQCCGGRIIALLQYFSAKEYSELVKLCVFEARGKFSASAVLHGGRIGPRECRPQLLCDNIELKSTSLVESFNSVDTPVFIWGAGHIGRFLSVLLAEVGFDVTLVDNRPDIFNGLHSSNPKNFHLKEPARAVGYLPSGGIALVMSHDHAIDLEVVHALLCRSDLFFVGLIGSKTKRARFLRRLRALGVLPAQLEKLVCPIGIAGLNSKQPKQIAVSVCAQLLQLSASQNCLKTGRTLQKI
ncbi:xanthine dehydrogenase accessory protein XdhC [Polycladidibacter hongkongensis]|uniref:xanthine dehydrogenase accessory protein XdhC n=1 Tax=Polycladidibacter hongkongensis TaxID=1647556 RepID=UPI0008361261|nr:xanthine dehydrogenase accessory protein XdhC [Pseudovibrio hongkongensis]